MNRLANIIICLGILSLTSCMDCEDKTLQVSDNLLKWLPYSSDTLISFSDQNNQSLSYTISPDVTIRKEEDDKCITTKVLPYILLENEAQPEFLQVWFLRQEDLLGDNDQLWGLLNVNDQINGSGAILNIDNPDLIASQVSLNGIVFSEVITLNLNSNGAVTMTIYLQKNVGLIGFEYEGRLWVVK